MEKGMYILVCIVAAAALAMIIMVMIAVLKVASDHDDEYEMAERIKFQAKEGLRDRDERSKEVPVEREDVHRQGTERD